MQQAGSLLEYTVEGEEGSKSDQGEELQGGPQRLSQLLLNSPSEWPHIEVKHPDILYPCFHLLANPEGCYCERGRSVCRSVPKESELQPISWPIGQSLLPFKSTSLFREQLLQDSGKNLEKAGLRNELQVSTSQLISGLQLVFITSFLHYPFWIPLIYQFGRS